MRFQGQDLPVQDLATFDFSRADIGLFSAGARVSARVRAECAPAAGCIVIDNTSQFRYQDDIPLVVPEVNPHAIAQYRKRGIIANPNCSTMQMLVALKPMHDAARHRAHQRRDLPVGVRRRARKPWTSSRSQTAALAQWRSVAEPKVIPKQIAFNCVPQIDKFQDNGYTKEEMKMVWETRKILEDTSIRVNATAVRVPVFFGHSEAVHIETAAQDHRGARRGSCWRRRRASWWSTSASRAATPPRLPRPRAPTRSTSAASARTSRTSAG